MPGKSETGVAEWIDPDEAPELTDAWFEGARWEFNGVPIPQPTPDAPFVRRPDVVLQLPLAAELADYFKTGEAGWETRIVEALRAAVHARSAYLTAPSGRGA